MSLLNDLFDDFWGWLNELSYKACVDRGVIISATEFKALEVPVDLLGSILERTEYDRLIKEARNWIADCEWAEDSYSLGETESWADIISNEEVEAGIERHYSGGLEGFKRDIEYVEHR